MNTQRAWLERGVGAVLLCGFALYWLRGFAALPPSDFDDAYMVLRYVRHVLDGHGLAWNVGEPPVYGVTSRLHFAWVLVLRLLFPSLSSAELLRVASGAVAVALVVAMPLAASLLGRPRRFSLALWTVLLVPAFAFTEFFRFHSSSGMDTQLSALANLLVALAAYRLCRMPSPGAVTVSVIAGYVAVLARPENAVPALLCPLLAVCFFAPVAKPRLIGQLVFSTLALWLLDAGLCARFLGTPVPLAFYAKRPGYYAQFAGEHGWNPYWFLQVFLQASWPAWVATLAFTRRRNFKRVLVLLSPVLVLMVALSMFNQIMGHMGRFYAPLLPFVVLAGAKAVDEIPWGPRVLSRTYVWLSLRLTAALGVQYFALWALLTLGQAREDHAPPMLALPSDLPNEGVGDFPEQDSWTAARAMGRLMTWSPAGTVFAMSEHGLPGALAPGVPILDLLGLHDSHVARVGFSASALFRRGPDVLWMPHPDHVGMWRDIVANREFQQEYIFFRDAFYYGVAVRKHSRMFAAWPSLMLRMGIPWPAR